jgi:hypothetical protein
MAEKHLKKCSTSLIIREMQIKATLRFYLTPIRMAKIKNSGDSRCWQECGERGTLLHCWWDCRLVQPLWKSVWQFLRKLITGPPMEELENVSKELKRSATPSGEQHYELTSTPELLTLAAYVSKDDLVGHHWKERPIGQANVICPNTGECQGQKMGMGG